ncbi:zinc-finger-containing domain protein [compost metagenome]
MHPQTAIPLGTLATASLRQARKVAKEPFERLWRPHHSKRTSAYEALAKHLGIEVESCHFGWFDEETCYKARDWATAELRRRGLL